MSAGILSIGLGFSALPPSKFSVAGVGGGLIDYSVSATYAMMLQINADLIRMGMDPIGDFGGGGGGGGGGSWSGGASRGQVFYLEGEAAQIFWEAFVGGATITFFNGTNSFAVNYPGGGGASGGGSSGFKWSSASVNMGYLPDLGGGKGDISDITPTVNGGGRFSNFSDFLIFMLNQAMSNPIEVEGFVLYNQEQGAAYIIMPWNRNDYNTSRHDIFPLKIIEGYSVPDNITTEYHTHPHSTGPSRDDAKFSQSAMIPVFTLGNDLKMWLTDKYYTGDGRKLMIPLDQLNRIPINILPNSYAPFGNVIFDFKTVLPWLK